MVSLREQMLKAGLVDQKKVKRVIQDKSKQRKVERQTGAPIVDEARQAALQAQEKNRERARELNAQRDAEARKKAAMAQVVQMVQQSRQSKGRGDVAYNFVFGTKVERIYVSAAVQAHLAAGHLAIVRLGEATELVPRSVAEKIEEREPSLVIRAKKSDTQAAEDDPYADYKIPDDFTW